MASNCGAGEDLWESLDSQAIKEIKPVNPKGTLLWIFIGSTDTEASASVLWPPVWKSWLIGKDPEAGKDWGQGEKRVTDDDEMIGWRHWLDGQEFEQAPGAGDRQGSLACCRPWSHKELDNDWMAELQIDFPMVFSYIFYLCWNSCFVYKLFWFPWASLCQLFWTLSGKSVTSFSLRPFSDILFFCLEYVPLFLHFLDFVLVSML